MISDPRIPAIAFGNVTWKMVLRCRWVGGDEKNERDARRDRRPGCQPQDGSGPTLGWLSSATAVVNEPLLALRVRARSSLRLPDFVHVEIRDFGISDLDMSEPAGRRFESRRGSCLASHLLRAREF